MLIDCVHKHNVLRFGIFKKLPHLIVGVTIAGDAY